VRELEGRLKQMERDRDMLAVEDPRNLLAKQQAMVEEAQQQARKDRAAREKLEEAHEAEKQANADMRRELDKRKDEIAARSLEFGEKEYYQVTVGQLQELQVAKEEEMSELQAKHAEAVGEIEAEAKHLRGEVSELRKQRQTMALSLSQYATLEMEWGEAKEISAAEIVKLHKEIRALKKKLKTMPALQKRLEASSHEEVIELRAEANQLHARLKLSEEQLTSISAQSIALVEELDTLKAEGHATTWLASEQQAEREAGLEEVAHRLKNGLAQRVMRQWMLRTVQRCWRGWVEYLLRRRIAREYGVQVLSDDEGEGRARTQPAAATTQLHENLAEVAAQGMRKLTSLF